MPWGFAQSCTEESKLPEPAHGSRVGRGKPGNASYKALTHHSGVG